MFILYIFESVQHIQNKLRHFNFHRAHGLCPFLRPETRADPGFGRDGVRAPIAPSRRKEGGSMFIFLTTT